MVDARSLGFPRSPGFPAADVQTRRRVLELLKWHGPQDAGQLAKRLRVSAMAVRQHLYALQEQKLVNYTEEPRPLGRPAKLWQLTAQAGEVFPNAHAELTVSLIQALRTSFGTDGVDKLLQVRAREQVQNYKRQMPAGPGLRHRLEALAQLRTREGYMAQVLVQKDGTFLLVENHCPICTAATACTGLCGMELQVFAEVLGPDVRIARTEHIVAGARRCAYRIDA